MKKKSLIFLNTCEFFQCSYNFDLKNQRIHLKNEEKSSDLFKFEYLTNLLTQ